MKGSWRGAGLGAAAYCFAGAAFRLGRLDFITAGLTVTCGGSGGAVTATTGGFPMFTIGGWDTRHTTAAVSDAAIAIAAHNARFGFWTGAAWC
jgi:hypothetical protein